MTDTLNPREALFAFAGWLTARKEPLTFSRDHNFVGVADAVEAFANSQDFAPVSDDFTDRCKPYPTAKDG